MSDRPSPKRDACIALRRDGLTRAQIAARLGISPNTVSAHLSLAKRSGAEVLPRPVAARLPETFCTDALRAAAAARMQPVSVILHQLLADLDVVLIDNLLDDGVTTRRPS